jgi:hypothetical protein
MDDDIVSALKALDNGIMTDDELRIVLEFWTNICDQLTVLGRDWYLARAEARRHLETVIGYAKRRGMI